MRNPSAKMPTIIACFVISVLLGACSQPQRDSLSASDGEVPPSDSIMTIVAARGDGDGAEADFRAHCSSCHMGNSRSSHSPSVWHLGKRVGKRWAKGDGGIKL
jgi:hypothetical protein